MTVLVINLNLTGFMAPGLSSNQLLPGINDAHGLLIIRLYRNIAQAYRYLRECPISREYMSTIVTHPFSSSWALAFITKNP